MRLGAILSGRLCAVAGAIRSADICCFWFKFGANTHGKRLDAAIIHDYVANPDFSNDFKNILCSLPLTDIGDGAFSYRYFMSEDDRREGFWFLMFYDAVLFMVKTEPEENHE